MVSMGKLLTGADVRNWAYLVLTVNKSYSSGSKPSRPGETRKEVSPPEHKESKSQ
jgi:hypothetical protein